MIAVSVIESFTRTAGAWSVSKNCQRQMMVSEFPSCMREIMNSALLGKEIRSAGTIVGCRGSNKVTEDSNRALAPLSR